MVRVGTIEALKYLQLQYRGYTVNLITIECCMRPCCLSTSLVGRWMTDTGSGDAQLKAAGIGLEISRFGHPVTIMLSGSLV